MKQRGTRKKYPMDVRWTYYLIAYEYHLMTDEDLVSTPTAEIEAVTQRKLEEFLDGDFKRIETYLKCLTFDPAVPG